MQFVHYPAFHGFEMRAYHEWMAFHKLRISFIVIPVMLSELTTSIMLSFGDAFYPLMHQIGLAIVILIWLITFFVQVPLHQQLSDGYSEKVVHRLVSTNRWRTLLWSLKSILGIYMLARIIG